MYKLIAIDIDGTLLNSYGEVTVENKKALENANKKGAEIVLTSGRMPKAILPIANEVYARKYLIAGNGSLIYDIEKEKTIYNKYVKKEKILEIIKLCEENSIYYNIYTQDTIITKSLTYNILFYHNENKKNPSDKKININITENVEKYIEEYQKDDFLKITICDSDKIIFEGIMNKLKQVKEIDVLEVAHMSRKIIKSGTQKVEIAYFYTEITSQNVNKWSAIEFLINQIGIKKENVMAIGDNINDEQMIKNSGLGIAMGNSSPYIKEIANKVVADNNSSGVAEAVEKFL